MGYIPVADDRVHLMAEKSTENGKFHYDSFAQKAVTAYNPLETFKVLPYMSAYHVSYNLDIHGPYSVTYPGTGQWLVNLEKAFHDLGSGLVDYALVGAVADQRNFLVRNHVDRIHPKETAKLVDSSCFLVLTTKDEEKIGTIGMDDIKYHATDPFEMLGSNCRLSQHLELLYGCTEPATLIFLDFFKKTPCQNHKKIQSPDGISSALTWEVF